MYAGVLLLQKAMFAGWFIRTSTCHLGQDIKIVCSCEYINTRDEKRMFQRVHHTHLKTFLITDPQQNRLTIGSSRLLEDLGMSSTSLSCSWEQLLRKQQYSVFLFASRRKKRYFKEVMQQAPACSIIVFNELSRYYSYVEWYITNWQGSLIYVLWMSAGLNQN